MAIYTLRSGATAHPEDSVMQDMTDLIETGGVVDLSGTDHLKVVQRAAGANMSVDIGTGRGFIKGSANAYPVRNTAAINVAVTNNTSGNPRKDAVVLYIDLAQSPDSTASNVVKSAVVAGTPAASPAAPTDGVIQTAVGGSNPFLRLANVTVANNETAIDNADIADARVETKINFDNIPYVDEDAMTSDSALKVPTQQSVKAYVDSGTTTMTNKRITKRVGSTASSATPTPDADSQDVYVLTALATAPTFGAPTGTPTNGQPLLIRILDNGTARALLFNAIYRFSTDIPAPTTTTLSKTMYLGFIYNSAATKWDCIALIDGF